MKNCVLFAAGIADSDKVYIIDELITAVKINLLSADYFVGINADSYPGTSESIHKYISPVAYGTVPASLNLRSDASAFQLALRLLKESGRRYDLYWFIHTKGGFHGRNDRRKLYIDRFIGKADEIADMFLEFPGLGSYGLHGVTSGSSGRSWNNYNTDHVTDICGNIPHDRFRHAHVNWSYIETFYALRGEAINHFLEITPDSFYDSRIGDICYFETVIPWIPSRMGLFPYVETRKCFRKKGNLNQMTRQWIRENNLGCPEFDRLLTL